MSGERSTSLLIRIFLFLVLCLQPLPASAGSWLGFYRPNPTVSEPNRKFTPGARCLTEIFAAQKRYDIPNNLLLAIGLQEAGHQIDGKLTVWPWTGNSGGKGRYFGTRNELLQWIKDQRDAGQSSIDVGCMQVNQKWHPQAFASLEEAVDPQKNVDYAARFLKALYSESKDWWIAAGRYHSSTGKVQEQYLRSLAVKRQMVENRIEALTTQASQATANTVVNEAPRKLVEMNWSADMTGLGARHRRNTFSIYSGRPLQPVLQTFEESSRP